MGFFETPSLPSTLWARRVVVRISSPMGLPAKCICGKWANNHCYCMRKGLQIDLNQEEEDSVSLEDKKRKISEQPQARQIRTEAV